jgi:hypothetical protein
LKAAGLEFSSFVEQPKGWNLECTAKLGTIKKKTGNE